MIEVFPVINCPDLECVIKELHQFEKFATWVHLDVADGKFTFHKTWNEPSLWPDLKSRLSLEVHCMVDDPETHAAAWLKAGAKRVIVHHEVLSAASAGRILDAARKKGAAAMIAINPETPAERLRPYFKEWRAFQVLSVHPGLAGQNFLPLVVPKISFLRREMPDAIIEVDGGMNEKTARLVREAGANVITSSKYVLESPDSRKAYDELRKALARA